IEAATHARMVEALGLSSDQAVLDIGDPSGYSAAILSNIASTVITLDQAKGYAAHAEALWNKIDANNIVAFEGGMQDGLEQHAPYNAMLINGAVGFVPQNLLNQLVDGGRLVAVLRSEPLSAGKAMLYIRSGDAFSERCLFDSAIPYLPGFEPKSDFKL
ncbi:MAG: protein-L-isoaspartate O-methyltransferase, partial [Pseudomonadota bacterium]